MNPHSGNYYFRYRTYAPDIGVFTARDPLGYVDGGALYSGYFAAYRLQDGFGLSPSWGSLHWRHGTSEHFRMDPKTGKCPKTLCGAIGDFLEDLASATNDYAEFIDELFTTKPTRQFVVQMDLFKNAYHRGQEAEGDPEKFHKHIPSCCDGFGGDFQYQGVDNVKHFVGVLAWGAVGEQKQSFSDEKQLHDEHRELRNLLRAYDPTMSRWEAKRFALIAQYGYWQRAGRWLDSLPVSMPRPDLKIWHAIASVREKRAELAGNRAAREIRGQIAEKLKDDAWGSWKYSDSAWKKNRKMVADKWREVYCDE